MRRSCGLALLMAALFVTARYAQEPPDAAAFPWEVAGDIDRVKFNEPSGIAWHPGRKTLFVVGDEGDLCEIKSNGECLRQRHLADADFEGVTVDPATGLLYLAVEEPPLVLELDPESWETRRTFLVDRTFEGKKLFREKDNGIEDLVFVPIPDHPEGGVFYATKQSFEPGADDPSALLELALPLRSSKEKEVVVHPARLLPFDVPDLAGLCWDAKRERLWVAADGPDLLLDVTRDGTVERRFALPGKDQEGIALDPEGNLYVAQDSGGILKLRPKTR